MRDTQKFKHIRMFNMATDIQNIMFTPEEEDNFVRDMLKELDQEQPGSDTSTDALGALLPPCAYPDSSVDCFPQLSEVRRRVCVVLVCWGGWCHPM